MTDAFTEAPARVRSSNSTDIRDSGIASNDSISSRGRSFSFLRRSTSKEPVSHARSESVGKKLLKRRKSKKEDGNATAGVGDAIPRLPSYQHFPDTFDATSTFQTSTSPNNKPFSYNTRGFYANRQMDRNISGSHGVPVPPIPEGTGSPPSTAQGSTNFDPYARTESMTNRGRYSYASSAVHHTDSPRRVRRRKDPTPFNVLVVGAKNCGKTAFIDFLRTALAAPVKRRPATPSPPPPGTGSDNSGPFTSHYLETELEGERIGLTLYDSKGLERHLVDLQLRETAAFLESKFQETFNEEQKVMRATGVRDTHVHCVFLVLDPSRLDSNIAASSPKAAQNRDAPYAPKPRIIGGLDEDLDVEIIRTLQGKTTVIPVISKADTITTAHMAYLKRTVWESLKKIKFDPLEALNLDSDGDSEAEAADESYINDESSEYQSADDDTIHNGPTKTNGANSNAIGKATLSPPSNAPQHGDVRVSHMSMNIDLPDLPMSIISPDVYEPGVIGRRFPWGFADPYNSDHCDFVRLKETVFSEWRAELREASREKWYEGWRTNRLKTRGAGSPVNARTAYAPPVGRAVSGSAAYGSISSRQSPVTPTVIPTRNISTSEIGVAIGDVEPQINGH